MLVMQNWQWLCEWVLVRVMVCLVFCSSFFVVLLFLGNRVILMVVCRCILCWLILNGVFRLLRMFCVSLVVLQGCLMLVWIRVNWLLFRCVSELSCVLCLCRWLVRVISNWLLSWQVYCLLIFLKLLRFRYSIVIWCCWWLVLLRIWLSCCCSNWWFGRLVRKLYWEMCSRLFLVLWCRWLLFLIEVSNWLVVVIQSFSLLCLCFLSSGNWCWLGWLGLMLIRCLMIFDSGLVSIQWQIRNSIRFMVRVWRMLEMKMIFEVVMKFLLQGVVFRVIFRLLQYLLQGGWLIS